MKERRAGFGFVEIIIATLIAAVCSIPIIMMVSSSRTDTSKAINYLRALELANEALEWAAIATDTDHLDMNLRSCGGSLIVDTGMGAPGAARVDAVDTTNGKWLSDGIMTNDIGYSDQYNTAFFLRNISVKPITSGIGAGHLSEVTVEVKWNEGKAPANPIDPSGDRMRMITLKTLIVHDNQLAY